MLWLVFAVSNGCLYPMETIKAVSALQSLEIESIELFLNSCCELDDEYIEKLKYQLELHSTYITSMHPFSSGFETFYFATGYTTRFTDGLLLYKKYFAACQKLNIKRLVFHGQYKDAPYPFEKHCRNFLSLRNEAKNYGVNLCYENVVRCKCGFVDNIKYIREFTNDDIEFVLDLKQMRRANISFSQMLSAMGSKISLIHLSDYDNACDCITPGKGYEHFANIFKQLKQNAFCGDMVLELYENGYKNVNELNTAKNYLTALYNNEDGAIL